MCNSQENICIEVSEDTLTIYSNLFVDFDSLSSLTLTIDDIYNETTTIQEVLSTDILTQDTNKYIVKTLSSGIYKASLRGAYTNGDIVNYHNCVFVDVDYKCDLTNSSVDGIMMHYALTKVTGCSCNCDDMKELFEVMLSEIEKHKTNCKSC